MAVPRLPFELDGITRSTLKKLEPTAALGLLRMPMVDADDGEGNFVDGPSPLNGIRTSGRIRLD